MYVLVIYYKHYNRRIKIMSGIVGSYFNTRGSGVVAKLGTDGQVFTSSGAGLSQGFETAAGGGKMLQAVQYVATAHTVTSTSTSYVDITNFEVAITPTKASSKILVHVNFNGSSAGSLVLKIQRDIDSAGFADVYVGDAEAARSRAYGGTGAGGVGGTLNVQNKDAVYLDSPTYDLTDEITYKLLWLAESNPTGMCLNRSTGNTNFFYVPVCTSSLTAIEIAA
jgi:hypothetical protein